MNDTTMKRFAVTVQHEVIMYAEDEDTAKKKVLANPDMKLRHKLECVSAVELPATEETTKVIDERKAPGA